MCIALNALSPEEQCMKCSTMIGLWGGLTPSATKRAIAFYARQVKGKLLETDAATAEMVKLVENASRDVQIAFANELSLACDKMGLNVWEVIRLANHHPRVNILQPGPGVGGALHRGRSVVYY